LKPWNDGIAAQVRHEREDVGACDRTGLPEQRAQLGHDLVEDGLEFLE
jgi:hypothetical protein